MKHLLVGVALASASLLAWADGTSQQYEQAAVNQAALDPNEAVVNDDGAVEAPNARMSGTARAYRNGYYNGKNAQREQDASNNPPPLPANLPPENQRFTQIPPQPRSAPVPTWQPPRVVARVPGAYADAGEEPAPYPAPRAYVQRDEGYGYARPQPPVNVYVQAPQPQQYYAPPPPPQPVYEDPDAYYQPPGPPQSTYVVVPGVPPALATGYLPPPFAYATAPAPMYRPMYRRPYVRAWVRW